MAEILETNLDTLYQVFNSTNDYYETGYYPTRREIIDYLIIQYPQYYINEDYKTKLVLLNSDIKCSCTDCGGNDSIIECKLEERYYDYINNPIVSL
jgi:hypothetical protein